MTPVPPSQLTLDFEPSLPERFGSLRAYLSFRVQELRLNAKDLAGDMDQSPSVLSRKLNPGGDDKQRFNTDDLEGYMRATKDTSPIAYLAAKFMDSDEARRLRAIARVETLAGELERTLATLRTPA